MFLVLRGDADITSKLYNARPEPGRNVADPNEIDTKGHINALLFQYCCNTHRLAAPALCAPTFTNERVVTLYGDAFITRERGAAPL